MASLCASAGSQTTARHAGVFKPRMFQIMMGQFVSIITHYEAAPPTPNIIKKRRVHLLAIRGLPTATNRPQYLPANGSASTTTTWSTEN